MDITDLDVERFNHAYERGDTEAVRAFWRKVSHVILETRAELVDSLLDDVSEGLAVERYLETVPNDFDSMGYVKPSVVQ